MSANQIPTAAPYALGMLRPAGDLTSVDLALTELGGHVAKQLQGLIDATDHPRLHAARRRLTDLMDLVGGPTGPTFRTLPRGQQQELLDETRLSHLGWVLDRHDYFHDEGIKLRHDYDAKAPRTAVLRSMAAHRTMLSANFEYHVSLVEVGEHETVYSAPLDEGWAHICFGSSHVRISPEQGADDEWYGWLAKMPQPLYRTGILHGWTPRGLVDLFERFQAYWALAADCEDSALGAHVGMFTRIDPIERVATFEVGHKSYQLHLSDDDYTIHHGAGTLERSEADRVLDLLADSGGARQLIELLRVAFDHALFDR